MTNLSTRIKEAEENKIKANIICGFAGVGKSRATNKWLKVVDLESTPFQKDWDTYARVAKHMADNGYIVLLSCHKEIRQKLLDNGIKFITVMPSPIVKGEAIDSKSAYVKRYRERGNTEQFINLMSSNWGEFNTTLKGENVYELPLDKYLSEILPDIVKV